MLLGEKECNSDFKQGKKSEKSAKDTQNEHGDESMNGKAEETYRYRRELTVEFNVDRFHVSE